ncbi:hypothetical protein BGX24_008905 [Mortierella sp. AD032]|nr:hypothetical protein BGX24_008905 [Mortierella sp. AD032]
MANMTTFLSPSPSPPPPFNIPNGMLLYIDNYLDGTSLWQSDLKIKLLNKLTLDLKLSTNHLFSLFRGTLRVTSLKITFEDPKSKTLLVTAIHELPNLKHLDTTISFDQASPSIQDITSLFTKLHKLTIRGLLYQDSDGDNQSVVTTTTATTAAIRQTYELRILDTCHENTFLLQECPQLKKLKITIMSPKCLSFSLRPLLWCPDLEELEVAANNHRTVKMIDAGDLSSSALTKLRSLKLIVASN